MEIEALAEEADRAAAQEAILSLARHWKLENSERRSYLTLILDKEKA